MELLIVMGMVGFIVSIGAPGMMDMVYRNRLIASQQLLASSIRFARGEAASRGKYVSLCKSGGSSTTCTTSGGWETGWLAFLDDDGDGVYESADDTLLRVIQGVSGSNTIRGNNNVANRVTFNATGSTGNNGTFRICDDGGASDGLGSILSGTGRLRSMSDSDGDGTVDDGGSPASELTCP